MRPHAVADVLEEALEEGDEVGRRPDGPRHRLVEDGIGKGCRGDWTMVRIGKWTMGETRVGQDGVVVALGLGLPQPRHQPLVLPLELLRVRRPQPALAPGSSP